MAIKKYKSKRSNKLNNKHKSNSKSSKKFKLSRKYHNKKKTQKRNKYNHRSSRNRKNHKGGFSSSCNLATIKEPGFSVDALGSIAGLSIPESRAAIYRPNCKTNSYQAMTP